MTYSTSNTYTLKREILTFSNKISRHLSKPDIKFTADMTYGMLASGSCLLTDIVDQLHETSKKVNSVERLTRHLNKGTPVKALNSYLSVIRKWIPGEPVIHIDDSDIVSQTVINLRLSVLSGMVLKVLIQKTFMKKAIMLQKPVF